MRLGLDVVHKVGRAVPKKERRKGRAHTELRRLPFDAEGLDPGETDEDSVRCNGGRLCERRH